MVHRCGAGICHTGLSILCGDEPARRRCRPAFVTDLQTALEAAGLRILLPRKHFRRERTADAGGSKVVRLGGSCGWLMCSSLLAH